MAIKKKVALALSSGGAKGMAHIGVIEALLEKGHTITSISGTSIGSLIGGIYASGKLEEYKDWITHKSKLDIFKLMDFAVSTAGLIKGEKVFNELKPFLYNGDISDLKILFTAVAVDILAQKEVIFKEGSLRKAIRASVAIPTVLWPLHHKGRLLIDGGVLSPLPLDALIRKPGDLVVAVDLNSSISYDPPPGYVEKPVAHPTYQKALQMINDKWSEYFKSEKVSKSKKEPGYFDLINLSIYAMQRKLAEEAIAKYNPDICVSIAGKSCDTFEFNRADEMVAYGKQQFEKAYQDWLDKVDK